jgi:hypothetical protein
MTIQAKQSELLALAPGEFIFFKHSELNEWQAALNLIRRQKNNTAGFEVTNDKIIRIINKYVKNMVHKKGKFYSNWTDTTIILCVSDSVNYSFIGACIRSGKNSQIGEFSESWNSDYFTQEIDPINIFK